MYQNADMETFGTRVKKERKLAKLTQIELARAVGMSQGNLSDIENDAVPTSTYTPALAKELGVDAHWLASGLGDRKGSSSSEPLSRKSEPSKHNPKVTKAVFDLLKELDRGDLSPELQEAITSELEAKIKFVRSRLNQKKKGEE